MNTFAQSTCAMIKMKKNHDLFENLKRLYLYYTRLRSVKIGWNWAKTISQFPQSIFAIF